MTRTSKPGARKLSYQLRLIRILLSRRRRGVNAEEAAPLIGCSIRTSFRHLSHLRNAGLLQPSGGGRYALVEKPKVLPKPGRRAGKSGKPKRSKRR